MKYQMASSSTEEGEIQESTFPYYKSYLQYYYYPLTTQFIGKNSVPNIVNYKSEGICLKLKKEIKNDYPYISFNILDTHKPFFDNKFIKIDELDSKKIDELDSNSKHNDLNIQPKHNDLNIQSEYINLKNNIELLGIKSDYKEIKKLDKKTGYENRYDKFLQRFLFNKDETPSNYKKIFVLEDRTLEEIENPNAFIFFRVILTKDYLNDNFNNFNNDDTGNNFNNDDTGNFNNDIKNNNTNKIDIKNINAVKYIFEDVFYNKTSFYKYLEIYSENIIKSHCSEEIKTYSIDDTIIFIHSSTTFTNKNNIKRRIYNGIDCNKNTMVLFNKEGGSFFFYDNSDFNNNSKSNLNSIIKMNLKEGDYVLNQKTIYKIGNNGNQVEFKGIEYEDFLSNIWEKSLE